MYNSIFGCALMYEIERQLQFPAGMNKILCYSMLRSEVVVFCFSPHARLHQHEISAYFIANPWLVTTLPLKRVTIIAACRWSGKEQIYITNIFWHRNATRACCDTWMQYPCLPYNEAFLIGRATKSVTVKTVWCLQTCGVSSSDQNYLADVMRQKTCERRKSVRW